MAREHHDRENLLGDAVAFTRRIEFRTQRGEELFFGLRPNGAASVYLDQDPVYHFNSAGELRRAFVSDALLKAERGQLVTMRRQRPGGEVQLISRAMTSDDATTLLEQIRSSLQAVFNELQEERLQRVGQVPDGVDVRREVVEWLADLLGRELRIADSPHAQ